MLKFYNLAAKEKAPDKSIRRYTLGRDTWEKKMIR